MLAPGNSGYFERQRPLVSLLCSLGSKTCDPGNPLMPRRMISETLSEKQFRVSNCCKASGNGTRLARLSLLGCRPFLERILCSYASWVTVSKKRGVISDGSSVSSSSDEITRANCNVLTALTDSGFSVCPLCWHSPWLMIVQHSQSERPLATSPEGVA